nr:MAG TPA: hypothetical protein [Caudoviricetes sp.]
MEKTMTREDVLSDVSQLEWEQVLEVMESKKQDSAYLVKGYDGKWELFIIPYYGETTVKITKDEVKQHIRNFRSKESY